MRVFPFSVMRMRVRMASVRDLRSAGADQVSLTTRMPGLRPIQRSWSGGLFL